MQSLTTVGVIRDERMGQCMYITHITCMYMLRVTARACIIEIGEKGIEGY